jgi:hypothetical protein
LEVGVCDRGCVALLREEVVTLRAQVASLNQKLLDVEALRRKDMNALRLQIGIRQQVGVLKAWPSLPTTRVPTTCPRPHVLQEVPTHQTSEGTQLLQATAPPILGVGRNNVLLNHPRGATTKPVKFALLDLPIDMLTGVCSKLGLRDLIRVATTCKRFRHGEGGLQTIRLPAKSPVITALCSLASPRLELVPSMRPNGCTESWVAYLARYVRQRRCREAPPIAAGFRCSLFVGATGQLLTCGWGASVGPGPSFPTAVAPMAGLRIRSVTGRGCHSLALGWDGRV